MMRARLVRESFHAMGTECEVAVTVARPEKPHVRRALAAAKEEIESCERALSRFRPESDLSRLNAAGGEWLAVDVRLVEALRVAIRVRTETGGRYDPTILPALEAAGYDRSFEELDERPATDPVSWRPNAAVELDVSSSRARVESGAAVDLGGIGKGYAAARALWAMREAWLELPGGLVDLGGDIAVWGVAPGDGLWKLAIADPRAPGSTVGTIAIQEGGVATSGKDRRRFGPGHELHHLIDPVTGLPAEKGPLAVTVVGPDAAEVEAYATALAITSVEDAPSCLRGRTQLSALLVPFEGEPVVVGALPLIVDSAIEGIA